MVFLVLCAKAQDKASEDVKGKRSEDRIRKKKPRYYPGMPGADWHGLPSRLRALRKGIVERSHFTLNQFPTRYLRNEE